MMNNQTAHKSLADCHNELDKLKNIIEVFTQSHSIVPFLTNYALIKCCGTIESCFKTIITDFHTSIPSQAKSYIENTFLNSSMNPSKANICKSLKQFDTQWNENFKNKLLLEPNIAKLESSLDSLNQGRNAFAHGGNPSISFNDVTTYFADAKRIIEILDEVVI